MIKQLTDVNGNKWNLTTWVDAGNRTYLRAYRNQWNAQKKRSETAQAKQMGRINDHDQSITLSKKLNGQFPELENPNIGVWYWLENALVTDQEYTELFNTEPEVVDQSWSNDSISVGATWALWVTAQNMGILDHLKEVFGKDAANLLALAIYIADGNTSMMEFEKWVPRYWLPEISPLDSPRISEMLGKITDKQTDEYFRLRHGRACSLSPNGVVTLSFDSTAISSQAETIPVLEYGNAKKNNIAAYEQVNFMQVCDHSTGDTLFMRDFYGSMNDKSILLDVITDMEQAGIDMTQNLLVTDRGFPSMFNLQQLINRDLKFLTAIPLVESSVKNEFRKHMEQLNDIINFGSAERGVTGFVVDELWAQDTPAGRVTHKNKLYLYKNPARAATEALEHLSNAQAVLQFRNYEADIRRGKTPRNTKQPVRPQENIIKRYSQFLYENRHAKMDEDVWTLKSDRLKEASEFAGCFALRSNVAMDRWEVLDRYSERNVIEQGFRKLKDDCRGDTLNVTGSSYKGKLFLLTLGQSILMAMRYNVRKNEKLNKGKLEKNSMRLAMAELKLVEARVQRASLGYKVKTLTKEQRDIYALLDVTPPPKFIYRFRN